MFALGSVCARVCLREGVFAGGCVCARVCLWEGVFVGGCVFGRECWWDREFLALSWIFGALFRPAVVFGVVRGDIGNLWP